MKSRWLNLTLHFSGIINRYKLKVIETTGPKIILYGLCVLLLEIANLALSLPAYAFIAPAEFAGSDPSVIRSYRLRHIVSLSVLAGMALSVFVWILVSFFGLVLFPGKSYASVASWDFNTPLAYNYDTTKIQITDGTAIFKASPTATQIQSQTPSVNSGTAPSLNNSVDTTNTSPTTEPTPTPTIEPTPTTPTGAVEPTPTPVVAPTPVIEPVVPPPAPAPVVPPPAPVPTSPLLFNNVRNFFKPEVAYAQNTQANTCSATLQTITPLIVTPFVKWTGFSETANKNGGEIYYALSGDGGLNWLYFDGSNWSASIGHGNTASEINDRISNFPITLSQTGAGTLMFKATFESDCTHDVSLLSLTADYQDQPSVIASFTSPDTSTATSTTFVTSESDPTVVAVSNSISASTNTSTGGSSQTEIPVINTPLSTETTNTTSLNTNTGVEVPSSVSGTPTVGTEASTSITTDTSLNTSVNIPGATPIAFSVHVVTKTTGTPGHTLYSIPGVFSLSEGPDNGLVLNVTGMDLQTTTLSYPVASGANAHVSVGDHIVVLVYDGSKLSLYIDGAISASLSAPIVIVPPANVSTSIGCVSAGFVLEALSVAQINANYLECGNHAPTLDITNAIQKVDDSFVDITYTTKDAENDFVSLPVYEYSKTGAFLGEEKAMTAGSSDTDHDGVSGITATSLGTEHTFVWNVKADLPNYAGTVYVRLRANDGLATSPVATFYLVRVDNKGPMISHLRIKQEKENNSVTISYIISDDTPSVSPLIISRSEDNGANWTDIVSGVSGNTSNINTVADGVETKTVTWNASDDFAGQEKTILLRLTTRDSFNNEGIIIGEVDVDTRAPLGLSALAGIESNINQILWHWSPSDDANFDRYIIMYGTESGSVTNGSVNNPVNVKIWGPSKDSDLKFPGTDRTVITGLTPDTLYYAKITAYDNYGHEKISSVASFKTQAEVKLTLPENTGIITPSSSQDTATPSEISGGVIVGETLPNTSTLPPTEPRGGFKIKIENGASVTESKNVTLALTAGSDTALMLISNKSDLSDASLQEYASTSSWDLCAGLDSCEDGAHTVYAKFYTSFGVGGTSVSDRITLNLPVSATPSENSGSTGSTNSPQAEVNSGVGGARSGSSGGGGNGPVISITTNESRAPEQNSGQAGNGNIPANNVVNNGNGTSNSGTVTQNQNAGGAINSSFVSTTNSVLQNTPELKGLSESRESGVLAKPEVSVVKKSLTGQTISFTGTGIPNAKIALFIHSDQVVVYTTNADEKGQWSFSHDQSILELAPGEHTVFAVTYDPGSHVKSKPSVVSTFYVKKSPAAVILTYTNLPTTLLTLVVLLFGTLYIYSRRREKML